MRMRKKKWVSSYIERENRYIIKDLKDLDLKHGKIYLEVGMGMGDFITQSAKRNPDIFYIGFEKVDVCIAKACKKAEDLELDNFSLILDTADNIENYFEHHIDRIYLHFSDPWPKKAHIKRRLTYQTYLEKYKKALKENGDIFFKTDNKDLFEFSILEFLNHGFEMLEFSVDYHRNRENEIMTGYETKFSELGQPIYYALFKVKK